MKKPPQNLKSYLFSSSEFVKCLSEVCQVPKIWVPIVLLHVDRWSKLKNVVLKLLQWERRTRWRWGGGAEAERCSIFLSASINDTEAWPVSTTQLLLLFPQLTTKHEKQAFSTSRLYKSWQQLLFSCRQTGPFGLQFPPLRRPYRGGGRSTDECMHKRARLLCAYIE